MTETGKVSYVKKDKESYLVTINNIVSDKIETRVLSLDQLTKWFYDLSNQYFKENIEEIELES
jgi:hypothetical protein